MSNIRNFCSRGPRQEKWLLLETLVAKVSNIRNKCLLLETSVLPCRQMANSRHFCTSKMFLILETFGQKVSNIGNKCLLLETWKMVEPGK
jgi:hypothetical protein